MRRLGFLQFAEDSKAESVMSGAKTDLLTQNKAELLYSSRHSGTK